MNVQTQPQANKSNSSNSNLANVASLKDGVAKDTDSSFKSGDRARSEPFYQGGTSASSADRDANKGDAKKSAQGSADDAEEGGFFTHAKDKVSSMMHDFEASDVVGKVTDRASELDKSVRGFVSARPFTSLAIAAGVGFIAAKALSMGTKAVTTAAKQAI